MNDRDYNAQVRRVDKLVGRWKPVLGLAEWHLRVVYHRDATDLLQDGDLAAGIMPLMDCAAQWEYKHAEINVNVPAIAQVDAGELEDGVIHELLHCQVAKMRDWTPRAAKHEERVVVELTQGIQRAYDLGLKDAIKEIKSR